MLRLPGPRILLASTLRSPGRGDKSPADTEGETGHAHGHLEFLEAVGDPASAVSRNISAFWSGTSGSAASWTARSSARARTERPPR